MNRSGDYKYLDLAINNGRVFTGGVFQPVNVGVTKGKIVTLSGERLQGEQEIDAAHLTVIPGAIDPHMHVWHGYPHENYRNATEAAARGGVTTLIDMPLDLPQLPSSPEAVRQKIEDAEKQALVDFALFGGISVKGEISEVEKIMKTGVVGLKIFWEGGIREGMYKSLNAWEIWQAFQILKRNHLTASVHCETGSFIDRETKRLMNEGKNSPEFYEDSRPIVSEFAALASTMVLAQDTKCRVNICHTSFARGVEFVSEFKRKGVEAFVETCPHYLTLTRDDLGQDKRLKVNPPLRAREKDALWALARAGKIDTIGSDHIPFPKEPGKNVWEIWGGLGNTVQIMLPLMLSEGAKYGVPFERMITMMTENPARIFGLYPRKGCITIGADADMVLLNTEAKGKIHAEDLAVVGEKWSPWDGWDIRLAIIEVVLRGQSLVREGKLLAYPGKGKFVPTQPSGPA